MAVRMEIGLDAITSYKRLDYTPWHALAEFIDNSTQAYFDNKAALDEAFKREERGLEVSVAYEKDDDILRISDNSIGMSLEDLNHALHVANPPANTSGRSKYGMGMKTAACWIGNMWTLKTKKLGETVEHIVKVDVNKIASGENALEHVENAGKPTDTHYTVIEITKHNRKFHGRTIGKIRKFLSSMYREDFRNGVLTLLWQGTPLTWDELDERILTAHDGSKYRKEFAFDINGRHVKGWVGILASGSRADAGFSIIHCGRVVKGWPDSWRPSSLYGQEQGSNDLVNQRLVGEVHLDSFDVSHTKDNILWLGDEEEKVEAGLRDHCADYREVARQYRRGTDEGRGPSETETTVAVDELTKELTSPEMIDTFTLEDVPPEEVISESLGRIKEAISHRETTFSAEIGSLRIKGFLTGDTSPHDPYVVADSTRADEVIIIISTTHPHWSQLKGSDGVLNYLRHCTYDAIAEWKARHRVSRIDSDTVKILKDKLLRVPFEIEMHSGEQGEED